MGVSPLLVVGVRLQRKHLLQGYVLPTGLLSRAAEEQERSASIEHRMVLLGYSGPKPQGEPLGFLIKLEPLQKKPKLVVWKVRVRKAGYLQGIDPSWCLVEGKGG